MAFEIYNMTGTFFENGYKESESDNRPNYTGNIKVSDKEYDIAGWTKTSKNGKDYISIKVSEKGDYEGKKPKDNVSGNLPF